uniref:Uncharacterized protein n=1 Tax=Alexandrium monilatum TaxID=311494 RepID=A0A7S4TB73_9DINO
MSQANAQITSKVLAAILSISASAPEDLEGLLFGRTREALSVIEGFLLTGRSWTLCSRGGRAVSRQAQQLVAEKQQVGQQLLGWCSLRAGFAGAEPTDRSPTFRERCMHTAVGSAMGTTPAIGCVVLRAARAEDPGALVTDSACFSGPSLAPLGFHVRSVGATNSGGGALSAPFLPVLGALQGAFAGLQSPLCAVTEAMEAAVKRALAELEPSRLDDPSAALHLEERRARELELCARTPPPSTAAPPPPPPAEERARSRTPPPAAARAAPDPARPVLPSEPERQTRPLSAVAILPTKTPAGRAARTPA